MHHFQRFWPLYAILALLLLFIVAVPIRRERAADGTLQGRRTLLSILRQRGKPAGPQQNVNTAPPANVNVPATNTTPPPTARGNIYGVIAGRQASEPSVLAAIKELGGTWVRVNYHFADDENPNLAALLDAGLNVVVTFKNDDPANAVTTYGTPQQWPSAGFPYKDKARYEQAVQTALTPVTPYLAKGRQVMAQNENEVSDASVSSKAKYWRGTTDQYLAQLAAFREAVQGVDPKIKIVLSSFASAGLDAVISSGASSTKTNAEKFYGKLLSSKDYDAADLHFYHCAEDIGAKAAWVKARMRSGTQWISTENGGPDTRCVSTRTSYDENPQQYLALEAQQVPQRLSACSKSGGSVCLWFSLYDLTGEAAVFTHMGLFTRENPPQKKPAYDAFKAFVAGR